MGRLFFLSAPAVKIDERPRFVWRGLIIDVCRHCVPIEVVLQRLAGDHPVGPVRILSDILEPAKNYSRGQAQHYTSFTPLNRLVDATRPESDLARQFDIQLDQALAGRSAAKSNLQMLRERLTQWRDNDARLKPIIADSFLLKEAGPLSETVTALASTGLQALDYIESAKAPSEDWKKEQSELLVRAKKPQAELLIMIVPAIQKLVDAADAGR